MNYDTMSVDEWLHAFYLVCSGGYTSVNLTVADITRELRKAVIREVQVGEIVIEQHEGYLSPDPLFSVGTQSKLVAGTFYIVPTKEAPNG
jgi:hypothetical protein